jgi:uncharacterized protein YdeI (YjbR/CyaY-like superfamily)
MTDLNIMLFETLSSWETWLETHHESSPGVWLKIAKKKSTKKSASFAEALDVALCFGWIDSQKRGLDEDYYLMRFTPRRKRSPWSAINQKKAEALIEQGRMRQAGQREIEEAQADGRWEAS